MLGEFFRVLKISIRFFLYPLYFISFLFPKNKNLWVIGCHNDTFMDNSKYFYLFLVRNNRNLIKEKIKFYWITGNNNVYQSLKKQGFPVFKRWSLKGLFIQLRAGIFIYSSYLSDINFWTSGRTIRINLWHGIPLKRIEYDVKIGKLGRRYHGWKKYLYKVLTPWIFTKPTYLLSTSPNISKIFSSAFGIGIERCLNYGYPRCDIFFCSKDKMEKNIEFYLPEYVDKNLGFEKILHELKKFNKIIVYMPTFRDKKIYDAMKNIDFQELNQFLRNINSILILKLHPNVSMNTNVENFSNIIKWDSKLDIYPFLIFTDLLITDYSSIMFDYLLLNKPIILYWYDKEHYFKSERGFYENIKKIIEEYFIIVNTQKDLHNAIKKYIENEFPSNHEYLKYYLWNSYEGNSSCNLYNFIKRLK